MLDNAALALLVATLFQTTTKPFLPPNMDNNLIRAVVGGLAYVAVLLNAVAANHLQNFGDAWGLIPQAGAVAAGAIATYHILSDIVAPKSGNYPPVEAASGPVKTLATPPIPTATTTTPPDTTPTT